ncbi:MAG: DUF3043 domain-containing protein [Nocardioides sp.]
MSKVTVFKRSKPAPAPVHEAKPGGKGRPTPTRKEAEEAARLRLKTPKTRKEKAAANREARQASSEQVRAALRGTGDERHLPSRDRGPVRRFIRDFIDSRLTITEFVLPLMVITLVMGYSGVPTLVRASNGIVMGTLLVVIFDVVMTRMRVRRAVAARFPDDTGKGHVFYAVARLMQIRWLRAPKPRIKVGQALPDDYR